MLACPWPFYSGGVFLWGKQMKAKTIKKVLRAKIDSWAETIDDKHVQQLVLKNTIITGGCIPSMLLQEKVNDYDVYFRDLETTKAVANYYVDKYNDEKDPEIVPKVVVLDGIVKIVVKSAGIAGEETDDKNYQFFETLPDDDAAASEYVENSIVEPEDISEPISELIEGDEREPYRPVFLSANAITLSDKIQIILRFYGTPDEIHENYDFVHCTCWWDSHTEHLELRQAALETMLSRELKYQGSKYPLCSIIRTRKFVKRGWQINAGQYLKMCMQLNELDLTDVDVLEDQLTGVDVAYFHQVIKYIKENDKDITTTYICEIIDRIF